MKTKHYLTNDDCKKILAACEAHAHQNNWAVCIAIVDDGGHLLTFQRLDACASASVAIAQGKARSAAIRRRATKSDEDMVNGGRMSALSMPAGNAQRDVPHSPVIAAFETLAKQGGAKRIAYVNIGGAASGAGAVDSKKQFKVLQYIRAHRVLGARHSQLDPLKRM